jgi:hypothetical protein
MNCVISYQKGLDVHDCLHKELDLIKLEFIGNYVVGFEDIRYLFVDIGEGLRKYSLNLRHINGLRLLGILK